MERTSADGGAQGELPVVMTRLRQLITEAGLNALVPEWRRLFVRLHEPTFSVAVAGEFSRGKSTLINRLLGADLVPVGDLPTTALLTHVRHGPTPALWHLHPDGKRDRLELVPESWEGLTAVDGNEVLQGTVQVDWPHPWLERTGIQLVDTPGAGDLSGTRAALAAEAVAGCDAALVVVSATMAMSLTERAFVEEHVLARRVPRVAVVLTRLDQVPAPDRARVVSYSRERLDAWAPEAALWCAHGPPILPPGAPVEAAGPEAILGRLDSWAASPEHTRLRQTQLACQLDGLAGLLAGALTDRREAAALSMEERERLIRAGEGELERTRLDWEDLRLEMEKRALATGAWVEETLQGDRDDLHADLARELRRARQVKDWWEKELVYLLRRRLLRLVASLGDRLAGRLEEDAVWLRNRVRRRFGWRMRRGERGKGPDLPVPEVAVAAADVGYLDQGRMLTRLGTAAVALTANLLFPGFASLIGTVLGAVVTEKVIRAESEEQLQALGRTLEEVTQAALFRTAEALKGAVRSEYQAVLDETRRQEELWLAARREAVRTGQEAGEAENLTRLDRQLRDVADLRAALQGWMKGGTP
jgi:hypothetical protein